MRTSSMMGSRRRTRDPEDWGRHTGRGERCTGTGHSGTGRGTGTHTGTCTGHSGRSCGTGTSTGSGRNGTAHRCAGYDTGIGQARPQTQVTEA